MVAGMGAATAQNNQKQRLSREEQTDKRAHRIADALALDDATTKRFVETYAQCQKEMKALAPERGKEQRRQADVTDEAVGERLKAGFKRQRQMLDLREKYYQEYSKFLTQKQIKRVYELERQKKVRPVGRHQAQPRGERVRMTR